MNIDKIRILGSGFTEEEYQLYRFDRFDDPADAMRYLSHRQNHSIYRPAINRGQQQHLLEDKWVTQIYLSSMGLPVPRTYGLYHPQFGVTSDGRPMATTEQVLQALEPAASPSLIFKPRGGRKGRNIILIERAAENHVVVNDQHLPLESFLSELPQDAFGDYDGCYHGWLVQERIAQHDKGGLSVAVNSETGTLGQGVFKPHYGGDWVSEHPDTGIRFEGERLPEWDAILECCRRAAATLSGIRAVGWDIALTPDGPVIIEGNATWGLPVAQVHTNGYLTDEIRRELEPFGARFPIRPRSLPAALLTLALYQWQRSRGPRILRALQERIRPTLPT